MSLLLEPVRLKPEQFEPGRAVLIRAFQGDPMLNYILPDSARQAKFAQHFFGGSLNYCMHYGEVYTTPGLEGLACWLPPGQTSMQPMGMLRSGIAFMPFKAGLSGMRRMLKVVSITEKAHERNVPEPHWYLLVLGVDTASQGKGIGGRLIEPILKRADNAGQPCYLETQKESNVPFYQKHGFEVVSQERIPDSELQFWTMRRNPPLKPDRNRP